MKSTKRKITSDIEDQICKKYQKGITTGELSKEYSVSRKTIVVYLNKNKIKIDRNRSKSRISKDEEINICKEYSDGLSSVKIGIKYNRNPSTIIRLLRRNDIKIRSLEHKIISKKNIKSICRKYESGTSIQKLADKYGTSAMTIYNYLKKADINTRKRGEYKKIISFNDHKQICESYRNGTNTNEISKKYNCNPKSIINILEKNDIDRRNIEKENHPNWKGGISFEPYCPKFNENFKEKCRRYWKRKCGICGLNEYENKMKWDQKLSIHHVNYNKDALCNNQSNLFIPLCKKCHAKTNGYRIWWETYLTNYLMTWFNGKTY